MQATTRWSSTQTRAQFTAIASLRWRIFRNQFRRKGGAGEMVGRIVMGLIFAAFTLFMMAAALSTTYLAFATGHPQRLVIDLWGAFLLGQFLNIQVGQPGTVFDPTQLIRFPMRARTYIAVRLLFGILSPGNILIALVSLSIAAGITIAHPSLWPKAFSALILFAITNALFSRMIFAWVDRWLSTRRSREVFTGVIFVISLGIQYLNVTFNPGLGGRHKHAHTAQSAAAAITRYHRAEPFLNMLPPRLISHAILAGNLTGFITGCLGCLAFAALFYAIFAWRSGIEFRGENLSDAAAAKHPPKHTPLATPAAAAVSLAPPTPVRAGLLSPSVSAVIGKELLQIRRNMGLFFGLVAPLFFVFLFARGFVSRTSGSWVLPLALVYVMMGVAPLSYNAFGLEGTGAQFYFMAPARLRDVFFAKNLVGFALVALDIAVAFAVIGSLSVLPGAAVSISCLLWVAATILLTTTLGNRRSVTAPKKIESGRMASKQASQTSSLIAFGILLGSAAIGAGLLLLSIYLNAQWFLIPSFAAFAVAGFFVYRWGQRTIDAFTFTHRDHLFEELSKKA
jgi:ABC-2 type transport system permease protein